MGDLLKPSQAAKRLNISVKTLNRIRASGNIRHIWVGSQVRYADADVDEYIERERVQRP